MTTQRIYETLFSNYEKSRSKAIFEDEHANAKKEIFADLDQLLDKGYNTYIIGLRDMYDILVAESLLEYRDTFCPQLHYYIITHKETCSYFGGSSTKYRIEKVIKGADIILETTKKRHQSIFYTPNQHLVDNLKMDVCYYHPYGDGGVLYCYKRDPFDESTQNMADICNYTKEEC